MLDMFYCGDAIEVMNTLPPRSIDLICADPPYNLGKDYGATIDRVKSSEYEKFTSRWLDAAIRLLRPGGSLYTFMGVRFISYLYTILDSRSDVCFNGWITWHYTQGMGRTKG